MTHTDCIRYLRDLGREISRNAEKLSNDNHPMADAHLEAANRANNHIEHVVTLLGHRESEQRAASRTCELDELRPYGSDETSGLNA